MSITITLTPEQEARLIQLAKHSGADDVAYVRTLIEERIHTASPQALLTQYDPEGLIRVLASFLEDDPVEQQETWKTLNAGLEASRESNREPVQ